MKKYWLPVVLIITLFAAAGFAWHLFDIYMTAFGGNLAPPATRADWGVMGDFFGGTLNPILSFLGLVMLLVTLIQNQKELELSRNELRESTAALAAQATTLERQRFEDTFFSLLDQLNRLLERLLEERVQYGTFDGRPSQKYSIVEELKCNLIGGGYWSFDPRIRKAPDAKVTLLAHDPLLNQYFRILYQILKFVATGAPDSTLSDFAVSKMRATSASMSEKFYSNLVRSFVPENVYYLLAINCYATEENDPYYSYKLLVERYAFLEHMPLRVPENQNQDLVTAIVDSYAPQAFGNNPDRPHG
ncbi:putative phage abortive infection protein [Sphaerotilus natans]|uniref:putative phage abortive infection protein n=1 Tax=Sphaerotilus natans TaxID=34103 RepID=UPI00406CD1A0